MAAATRVSAWSRPEGEQSFTPWSETYRMLAAEEPSAVVAEAAPPTQEDLVARAFAEGFDEGRRTVEMEVAAERAAIARLAEALEVLEPEQPHELGAMLAETVERLVRQIVGEVAIDGEILLKRAMDAAALISDECAPGKMRLHPDDLDRLADADLPVEMVADPHLAPGTVLLDAGEGWIEDGPEVGLEKLRIALDRLGVPR